MDRWRDPSQTHCSKNGQYNNNTTQPIKPYFPQNLQMYEVQFDKNTSIISVITKIVLKSRKKDWSQIVLGVKIGGKGGLAEFNEDEALKQFAPFVTGKELLKKKLVS